MDPAEPRRVLWNERLLEGQFGRIRDVVVGPAGEIYFCTNNGGDQPGSPGRDLIARLIPVDRGSR